MSYLIAAVVLLGLVCAINLVITLALARHVRDAAPAGPPPPLPHVVLGVGEQPADFAVETVEGELIDRAAVAGGLVGFFSPHCPPCHDRLAEFVEYARHTDALAVLVGAPEDVTELKAKVTGVARIVIEEPAGPLYTAFGVRGLPALCLLDNDAVILASGTGFATFPVLEPAR